ncbi:MAG: hypothetical protein K6F50_06795 [Kiritimatiellae bacterium]|nr:hypothetical protein [Kiritimatiellia bacterium]
MRVAIHTNETLPPSARDSSARFPERLGIRMAVGTKVRTVRALKALREAGLLTDGQTIAEMWPSLVLFLEHAARTIRNGTAAERDFIRRLALPLAELPPVSDMPTTARRPATRTMPTMPTARTGAHA